MSILSNSPNFFLSSLSPEDAKLLQPHIKLIELPATSVLYKTEETIERVYFPYSGIVSFVVGVSSGQFVEAGVIGRNSAVGIGAALDGAIAINEAIAQVAISGVAINTSTLRQLAAGSEALRISCARHEEMMLGQVQQVAACNAVHNLQQRLARWLLQAHDLLGGDEVPLTHDYLSQMLGANRSSVTLAAREFQRAGLIDYHRGHIRLLDVDALKDVSCECYETINAIFFRLVGWSSNGNLRSVGAK
jgi:CRP-like cAMP-binding protein